MVALVALVILACGGSDEAGAPPSNATVVEVVANSSLTPWLTGAISSFNESKTETPAGNPIFVTLTSLDAGQAVVELGSGLAPAIWLPDHEVWTGVLADQGNANYQGDCVSVAQSPLVIAMWQPAAEALGWPGRALGWLDVGSLAADPTAWAYYSGGQFGDVLRLGHTHPGLSGTGTSTLLALVQAAESTSQAVSTSDIEQPIVQASVGAFESAVSWFSSSTADLAQTMRARGTSFLGAAVMYESDVVQYGAGDPPLVPIYPFEGTFMATHPACLNQAAEGEVQAGARLFRDYLLGDEAQQMALAAGLRPVNDNVPAGAPLDASRGVDLSQPAILFDSPSVDTVYAVQDLWQSARKDVNLVMVVDVSGSMRGGKIDSVRAAASQFANQMGDDDYLTIIAFSTTPEVLLNHQRVGDNRAAIDSTIAGLTAYGDTALYDAIGLAAALIEQSSSPETSNAMVVLSDGLDTISSDYSFNQRLIDAAAANGTTVFTIAYGSDADEAILSQLALQANGNFFRGDEASIAAIYEEMSAAFGGSVGVGR